MIDSHGVATNDIETMGVDCEQCAYGASGGDTVACCYYGVEECDPYGSCGQFELRDDSEEEE